MTKVYIVLHVKCSLFSSYFKEIEISRHTVEKYWNIKSRENPSSGSRDVPCGQTDMTKL